MVPGTLFNVEDFMLHLCGARQVRELVEHQRLHSGLKIVRCHICEKDFTEKGKNFSLLRFFTKKYVKILEKISC
jgi:hypothetical protein